MHHVRPAPSDRTALGSDTGVVRVGVAVDNSDPSSPASGKEISPSDSGTTAPLGHVPSRIQPACKILIYEGVIAVVSGIANREMADVRPAQEAIDV